MNSDTQNIINSAWVAESENRLDAYRTGKLTALPFEDVMIRFGRDGSPSRPPFK
jgi:Putative addiction module component